LLLLEGVAVVVLVERQRLVEVALGGIELLLAHLVVEHQPSLL
jgi:hypothetical protein